MKLTVWAVAITAIVGLITGIVLIFSGKTGIAGIVWAVIALVSFISYRVEKKRLKEKLKENRKETDVLYFSEMPQRSREAPAVFHNPHFCLLKSIYQIIQNANFV